MPVRSIRPAATSGASASAAAVTWQPGVATRRAPGSCVAVQLGQAEHRLGEQLRLVVLEPVPTRVRARRPSAGRPPTGRRRTPTLPTSCGASAMLASCGSPRNTTSRPSTRSGSNSSNTRSGYAAVRLGYTRAGERAGLRVAGGEHELERRVLRDQPQQLGAGVARRADDGDAMRTGGEGRHAA